MGATAVILGTLYEENGQISLTIHLEGFGPVAKEADIFQVTDKSARFPVTEQMHAMLFKPGPNYAANPMISRRNQEYSRVVGEPECLAAPVVGPRTTQTQLAPLNSKELCSYRSSSPPKEKMLNAFIFELRIAR